MVAYRMRDDVDGIFRSVAEYIIGDGADNRYWTTNWTGNGCFAWRWPILYSYVGHSRLSVAQAMVNHRWVRDLQGSLFNEALGDFFQLWDEVHDVALQPNADAIRLKLTGDGQFSAASAY
uniref:Uncharacterized protein n=1 Tax=Oryza glaberrima TaxID=4538 RepID=I1PUF9_ORYGL